MQKPPDTSIIEEHKPVDEIEERRKYQRERKKRYRADVRAARVIRKAYYKEFPERKSISSYRDPYFPKEGHYHSWERKSLADKCKRQIRNNEITDECRAWHGFERYMKIYKEKLKPMWAAWERYYRDHPDSDCLNYKYGVSDYYGYHDKRREYEKEK